ncbi:uncharacterized LabA/DUF88 family protein [Knoellia remsis]|uniref:Uncharacterized LabA/DUF88 family protein n=1 Tax=Knoellia remsis TaxID=407159 RepID=A0A2T0U3I8_9MICO|nr:NYN domain-containing protein [Knoellia remsis]PRY52474.1 uncharacterized LabA/DUF88 family protein [Knoellia remsis]
MRSYCAVYVDVGYLLASSATRVTGSSLRSGVEVDYTGLVRALIAQVEAHSGLPLLRVNWYDSGARRGGQPDYHQDLIGLLPRVKLRLGRLSFSGEQKGVDVRLGLDLALQGRARVADVIYLVSGDDDLTEAVEEAQSAGVQVVIFSVPGQDGIGHAVSKHMRQAADGELLIDPEAIDLLVRPRALNEDLVAATINGARVGPAEKGSDSASEGEPVDAPASEDAAAASEKADDEAAETVPSGDGVGPGSDSEKPTATTEPVPEGERTAYPSTEEPETEASPVDEEAAPKPGIPTPAVLGSKRATEVVLPTATPSWTTSSYDEEGSFTRDLIDDVARNVVLTWSRSATPDALASLRESKPTIPGDLDRALLHDLSSRAGVYDIDDGSRHLVRDRFWFHVGRLRLT